MTKRKKAQKKISVTTITSYLCDVRMVNIIVAVLIAFGLVGYLAVSTQSATKGFVIERLEREIASLEDVQKRLDVETFAHQSMERIEERIGDLGFVSVENVEYLTVGASIVAVR